MRAGQVLYSRGYGMADVANGIPMTPKTALYIASASKQFTALAILLLEKDGKLDVDDNIRKYIPEVPNFGHPVTIRELLNHTSGLREVMNLLYMSGWRSSDTITKEDILDLISRQRELNHVPGAEFAYNNTGYILLTNVVEHVSGIPFRRFVSERIFQPLGMSHSQVRDEISQSVPNLAVGYWGHDPANLRTALPPYSFAGSTGVITTLEDLASWDRNFYEPSVGTSEQLNDMSTPGRLTDGTEFGYGMGLFIGSYRGQKMISHAGADPGYRSELIRFPEERISVAVMCNAFDIAPTPLALKVADIFLNRTRNPTSSASIPPTQSAPNQMVNSLAGLYFNDAVAQTRRFLNKQGKLMLDGGGEGFFELRVLGHNSYQLMAAPRRYVFTFVSRGPFLVLQEDIEGSPRREYKRVIDTKPSLNMLRALEGSYYSPELDVIWKFVLRNGTLVLERHRMKPVTLSPLFGKVFQAQDFFVLDFRQDSRAVQLVYISTERARRLRFTRLRSPPTSTSSLRP